VVTPHWQSAEMGAELVAGTSGDRSPALYATTSFITVVTNPHPRHRAPYPFHGVLFFPLLIFTIILLRFFSLIFSPSFPGVYLHLPLPTSSPSGSHTCEFRVWKRPEATTSGVHTVCYGIRGVGGSNPD
jgi:hypothetical protein